MTYEQRNKFLTQLPDIDITLVDQFKTEVSDRSSEIDPEETWSSLILGWAIAKGLTPIQAQAFSIFIRYHTDLG